MAVKYEAVAITGTYTGDDGNERKRYARLGVVLETRAGLILKLETIPVVPGWDGAIFLNPPRGKDEREAQREAPKAASPNAAPDPDNEFNDDIPF